MDQCPACNAAVNGQRVCRRCKADLGKLMDMEQEALIQGEKARNAFEAHRYHDMYYHAKRFRSLKESPESSQLLASAAILVGKYDLAYTMWRQLNPESTVDQNQ